MGKIIKKKTRGDDAELRTAYYTAKRSGAYGGVTALLRTKKKTNVRDWLASQDTYTLHKPVRRTFPRRKTIVGGIDHQWQADLIDTQRLKKDNDGYNYILTVIDVLSKFAWAVPLKNKTGPTLVSAFDSIFADRQPQALQTDKGTEFINKTFQKYLKDRGVRFFTTENEDIKASIVERFNRTLKEKLWRYFTKHGRNRYLEALPDLLNNYNHSYHRSIKTTPASVNRNNQEDIWQNLYGATTKQTETAHKLKIGDRVRISKARRTFKKGYLPSWTEELFTISRVKTTRPTTYVLKDDHGEELKGTFYQQEIQKVATKDVYKIESVLKRRGNQYLVKWYGYPPSFNSWIPKSSLTQYVD